MRDHGATVVAEADPDLEQRRNDLGIPTEAASCHTAFVGGYAVEGHVPAEAIARLVAERPDAVGIAVPGMPSDSPGMGGDPAAWSQLDVFLIGHGGELIPFDY